MNTQVEKYMIKDLSWPFGALLLTKCLVLEDWNFIHVFLTAVLKQMFVYFKT